MSTLPLIPLVPAENAVRAQFANPPSIETVTRQLLADAIKQEYPTLIIDLERTRIAIPRDQGGWTLQPLMPMVFEYLGSGIELDFSAVHGQSFYMTDDAPSWLTVSEGELDMRVIARLIKELTWRLPIGLQDALTAFWGEDSGAGGSRWQWLSDVIKDIQIITAFEQMDVNENALDSINQVINTPRLEDRIKRYAENAVRAYWVKVSVLSSGVMSSGLSPRIALATTDQVLVYKPNGVIRSYKSIDSLSRSWGSRISQRYAIEDIRIKRFELEGNVFEACAAAILNQQLARIDSIKLPASIGWQALKDIYTNITDTSELFIDARQAHPLTLESLKAHIPDWLSNATPAEQALYRQYTLNLSAVKKVYKGQTYLSGISDIHTYTADVLLQQMRVDQTYFEHDTPLHALAALPAPEDIELTFLTTAGLPGAVGVVEPVTMSLPELALKNLVGRPKGRLTLRHRNGLTLPTWLTPEYITQHDGLIEKVNIGKSYPERLKDLLLNQTSAEPKRERLFAEQINLQLPLQALEHSLKKENGVTAMGARYVEAVVQPGKYGQRVDGAAIVMRCLALVRKPEAVPDVVANMFIIEPFDFEQGPHLLYRPFYAQSLLEFPTRSALLNAIAEPGELQASVLTWMTDIARPIYDNGGFKEPHYVRYGLGSDFAPIEFPEPALLATNGTSDELMQYLQNGQLMLFLYGSNARALVDQAETESVSNSESRWGVLLEGGSLILNSLLVFPGQPRPLMLSLGLLTLTNVAINDIPALASADKATRELAAADVLTNLGMLLLHPLLNNLPRLAALPAKLKSEALRPFAPVRNPDVWPTPPLPKIDGGVVALTGEYPNTQSTALDFRFTSARNQLTSTQRTYLDTFEVARPAPMPPAQPDGQRKGLFRINDMWHALIDGSLYTVDVDPNGAAVIVSASNFNHFGPAVKNDRQGNWTLDLRLRNRGGMPPKRIAAYIKKTADRILELNNDLEAFYPKELPMHKTVEITQAALQSATMDFRFPREQLSSLRDRLNIALQTQLDAYQKLLDSAAERITLKVPFKTTVMISLLEKAFDNRAISLSLSAREQKALIAKWPQFSILGPALEAAGEADPEGFAQFVREQVALNEQTIERLEQRNGFLDQLYNLGSEGAAAAAPLSMSISEDAHTALGLKGFQLDCLKLISTKTTAPASIEDSLDQAIDPLKEHTQTHNELNAQDFDPSKRLEVLESLVEHYGQALDALSGIGIFNTEELEINYFNKLRKLLEELYQDATKQLAAEIKPVAAPRKRPRSRTLSAGSPEKKVINVKGKGKLIGEVKPAGREWPIEVIEIRSDYDDKLLSTYSQRGEEWVEILTLTPPVIPATRALNVIKGEARKVYGQYQEHLRKAQQYKALSRHPEEVEELLSHAASKLDKLANELHVALQAVPLDARILGDQTLLDGMRNAAQEMFREGKALRIQLSLELPPTHGNLQYLLDQDQVQIAGLGKRIKLQGERRDFIQEYAINNKEGFPVWYAHFHYAQAKTPKINYAVAHLKTKAQRRLSYYSQLAEAELGQAIVNVHRGQIGKAMAERWFLPLAGDE